ncbi:unknown [Bacteroides sp. CAG:530]|nr:unknown [Bacteroides sp. CAG:530]
MLYQSTHGQVFFMTVPRLLSLFNDFSVLLCIYKQKQWK